MQHTSLEAGDTTDQKRHDIDALFDHARAAGNVICTGTEAGTDPTRSLLEDAAADRGFYYVVGGDSWVAIDQRWATRKVDSGFVKVLDSGSGHSARGVTYLVVDTPVGRVAVAAMHLLTAKSSEQEPYANGQLQDAAVSWAKEHGPLSFVCADTNIDDQARNVWSSSALTTCWDELGKWPGTIETGAQNTIDVISRLTAGPTRFTTARRYTDKDLDLYADHQLIEAGVKVT